MLEILFSVVTSPLAWIGAIAGVAGAYLAWNFLPVSIDRASVGAILVVGGVLGGYVIQYLVERERSRHRDSGEIQKQNGENH